MGGRLILRWILETGSRGWGGGMDWSDLAHDSPVEGSCECGNEPSGFHNILGNS
jgi:hypothetical protein